MKSKIERILLPLQAVVLALTVLALCQTLGLYDIFSAQTIMVFSLIALFLSANVCLTLYSFLKTAEPQSKDLMKRLLIYALIAFTVLTALFTWFLYEPLGRNFSFVLISVVVSFYGPVAYHLIFMFTKNPKRSLKIGLSAPLLIVGFVFVIIYLLIRYLMDFGGIKVAPIESTNHSKKDRNSVDISDKASYIEHDGPYTHLVLNDGSRIQLSNWYSANGEAMDYAGKKYVGLHNIRVVHI